MSQYTVLKYTLLEFDKNWQRTSLHFYQATSRKSQVLVVTEGETVIKHTYLFQVNGTLSPAAGQDPTSLSRRTSTSYRFPRAV